jgi:hypothetical protein
VRLARFRHVAEQYAEGRPVAAGAAIGLPQARQRPAFPDAEGRGVAA